MRGNDLKVDELICIPGDGSRIIYGSTKGIALRLGFHRLGVFFDSDATGVCIRLNPVLEAFHEEL